MQARHAKPLTFLFSFSVFRGLPRDVGSPCLPESHRSDFAFLLTGTARPLHLIPRLDTLKSRSLHVSCKKQKNKKTNGLRCYNPLP